MYGVSQWHTTASEFCPDRTYNGSTGATEFTYIMAIVCKTQNVYMCVESNFRENGARYAVIGEFSGGFN